VSPSSFTTLPYNRTFQRPLPWSRAVTVRTASTCREREAMRLAKRLNPSLTKHPDFTNYAECPQFSISVIA